MSLRLEAEDIGGAPVAVHARQGSWTTVAHVAPGAVVAAVGAVGPGEVAVELDGTTLTAMTAAQRHAARLCSSGARLDPLPALRVADVIGLGLRAPQPRLWQALIGTASARSASDDDEAQVRALAGRVGLSRWVDRTAVNLPLKIEALVDLTRALAGLPKALVWRRPDWLDAASLAEVNEALKAEQRLGGFTIVEFTDAPAASLARP